MVNHRIPDASAAVREGLGVEHHSDSTGARNDDSAFSIDSDVALGELNSFFCFEECRSGIVCVLELDHGFGFIEQIVVNDS
jgi:hypothetical protein